MIKFSDGRKSVYVAPQHIVSVKEDIGTRTIITTTAAEGYATISVAHELETVVQMIEAASRKGADQ